MIALLSPCGWGNLGDAAILDAVISAIRARQPDANICAFTQNPEDTERRHGVPSFACSGYSLPYHTVAGARTYNPPGPVAPFAADRRHPQGALKTLAHTVPYLVPLVRRARARHTIVELSRRFREETLTRLEGCRTLVVAGGGQLDDSWGGAWGHPHVLRSFGGMARAIGARFVFLSVGVGSLGQVQTRRFLGEALRHADYRSYRDAGSKELLSDFSFTHHDPIVPDLAFSLPVERTHTSGRRVGVGPMSYRDPRLWPSPDPTQYERHLQTMAELVTRLIAQDYEVVLYSTTDADARTSQELHERLGDDRVERMQTTTVEQLLSCLSGVDLVVAARLHAVLLAHLLHKPVLAVSYDRKIRSWMEELGHAEYCLQIDSFDPDEGIDRLREIDESRGRLTLEIKGKISSMTRELEEQYDRIFTPS